MLSCTKNNNKKLYKKKYPGNEARSLREAVQSKEGPLLLAAAVGSGVDSVDSVSAVAVRIQFGEITEESVLIFSQERLLHQGEELLGADILRRGN